MTSVAVCRRCATKSDEPFVVGASVTDRLCLRCYLPGYWLLDSDVNEPRPVRGGGAFSTSRELATWPGIVWDVNGYYRDLGVPWWAARADIRSAYMQAEGWLSVRLTYVAKQLLNAEVRRVYDACSRDDVFFDQYVMFEMKERLQNDLLAAITSGSASAAESEPVDLSASLGKSFSGVDTVGPVGQDVQRAWGYWSWQDHGGDPAVIDSWRALLSEALWRKGRIRNLAVGLSGCIDHLAEVKVVQGQVVAFLAVDTMPTTELAEHIALAISKIR